jgi:hypothetical protein
MVVELCTSFLKETDLEYLLLQKYILFGLWEVHYILKFTQAISIMTMWLSY